MNWPAVCEMGKENPALMTAALTLDPQSTLGKLFFQAFSRLQSENEVHGPVPLSLLRREDREMCAGEVFENGIMDNDVFKKYSIPQLTFWWRGKNLPPIWATDVDIELPEEIAEQCRPFQTIDWNGRKWFVSYHEISENKNDSTICLVPAERVAAGL
jgi:hypothetical protein